MREILFRGKWGRTWIVGDLQHSSTKETMYIDNYTSFPFQVVPETVGQFTGLIDKNGKRIFEWDIVQYNTFDDFDCYSIVKIGKYKQDGSGGEYTPTECYGAFVEVDNFTCPDWAENDPDLFPKYLTQQNLLEVASECEIIGNIYDNPELLKGDKNE